MDATAERICKARLSVKVGRLFTLPALVFRSRNTPLNVHRHRRRTFLVEGFQNTRRLRVTEFPHSS